MLVTSFEMSINRLICIKCVSSHFDDVDDDDDDDLKIETIQSTEKSKEKKIKMHTEDDKTNNKELKKCIYFACGFL